MSDEVKQNTPEWHKLRKQRIGASESPIIMGLSPYKTIRELYLEKISEEEIVDDDNGFVKNKGHRLEPIARAHYELHSGLSFPDTLAVHGEYPYIGASLDGFNEPTLKFLEIKYVGAKQFEAVIDVKTFREHYEHYYCQMQHQAFVTGGEGTLVMINDKKEVKWIDVPTDIDFIAVMIPALVEFWRCVQERIIPPVNPGDTLDLPMDKSQLLASYKVLVEMKEYIDSKIEDTKFLLLDGLEKCGYKYGKSKILYVERVGSVQYDLIEELKNIDLNKYRKPSTASYTIKVQK